MNKTHWRERRKGQLLNILWPGDMDDLQMLSEWQHINRWWHHGGALKVSDPRIVVRVFVDGEYKLLTGELPDGMSAIEFCLRGNYSTITKNDGDFGLSTRIVMALSVAVSALGLAAIIAGVFLR